MAAAVAAAHRLAPSPRSMAASLWRAVRRLAPAVADAVMCLCVANVWLWFAGLFAVGIGRLAGKEDSLMVEAASKVVSFCDDNLLYAFVIAMQLFVHRVEKYEPDEKKEEKPMSRRFSAASDELSGILMPGLYATVPVFLLMLAGDVLMIASPVEGSREEALGSLMIAVAKLGKDALWCFIIVPIAALKLWRVTRPGWQSGRTVEKKSLKRSKICEDA